MNTMRSNELIRHCRVLATGAVLALTATTASAAKEIQAFEMVVLGDTHGGRKVLAGKIEQVLDTELRLKNPSFNALTNHCVSLTLSGDLGEAESICGAAVAAAESKMDKLDSFFTPASVKSEIRVRKAMALSNRGVLRALQGDTSAARADFSEAWSLTQRVRAPKANLARLERAEIVALVD